MSYVENYKPVQSNPWLALQAAKRHFRDLADVGLNLLDDMCTDSLETANAFQKSAVGASGRYYSLIRNDGSNDLIVKVLGLNSTGTGYVDEVTATIENYFSGYGMNDLTSIVANGLSLSSILLDINNGVKFNECLSGMCNAFQTSNNLTYSDISSILAERFTSTSSDITYLLDIIKTMLRDGKLNSYSWLSLLSNLLRSSKQSTDDGKTLLDTSKPFMIQSMISYFFVEIVPLVVSTVAMAVGAAIGAIIYVIASLLATVFKFLMNNATTIALSTDSESTTDYVKGPVIIVQHDKNYARTHAYAFGHNVNMDDGFTFSPFGPIHVFQWSDTNSNSGYTYTNGFLSVGWNWRKAIYYYYNRFAPISTHDWGPSHEGENSFLFGAGVDTIKMNEFYEVFTNPDFYLSADEVKAILADQKATAYNLYMSIFIYNAITQQAPNETHDLYPDWINFDTYAQPWWGNSASDDPSIIAAHRDPWASGSTASNSASTKETSVYYRIPSQGEFKPGVQFRVLGNILWSCYYDGIISSNVEEYLLGNDPNYRHIKDDVYAAVTENQMNTFLQSFYSYIYNDSYRKVVNRGTFTPGATHFYPDVSVGNPIVYYLDRDGGWIQSSVQVNWTDDSNRGIFQPIPATLIYRLNTMTSSDVEYEPEKFPITYQVDSLPVDRGISIANTSSEQIIKAIALVATVTTAVVAVSMGTKRWRQAKANKRKHTWSTRLSEARELYDAAPDDPQVAANFNSEVRKYNLRASIFGWGTYDAANNWFDSPASASESLVAADLVGQKTSLIPDMMNSALVTQVVGEVIPGASAPTLSTLNNDVDENTILLRTLRSILIHP